MVRAFGEKSVLDCLIVGGGPAGLTAAIYLARYRRRVAVYDSGQSRAAWIPKSRNYPGFPTGIAGREFLQLLRRQAQSYEVPIVKAHIDALEKTSDGFAGQCDNTSIAARTALLATGIVDDAPEMDGIDDAVRQGLVRYCPVCDGYEATDQKIAVLGAGPGALAKAKFLRAYSRDVTLLATHEFGPREQADAESAGIRIRGTGATLRVVGKKIAAESFEGTAEFDALYPALGCHVGSGLAAGLGAATTDVGCLKVDEHQQTSVTGLFAAGDVVSDLHQIAVGAGHAAIAATRIHKVLPASPR